MKTAQLLSLAILPLVACQTTKVCDTKTSVCFQQLFNAATNTTLGLVFPPKGGARGSTDDVIVKLTTALPYGYVGFGFSAPGKNLPEFGLVGWVKVIHPPRSLARSQDEGPVATLPSGLLAQQSILSTNVFTPSAGDSGNTVVSISPESSYYGTSEVTFLFRCQQCSATAFSTGDFLTLFRSATSNAPLEDFTVSHIPIENIDIFRNEEFNAYASRLGLA